MQDANLEITLENNGGYCVLRACVLLMASADHFAK
jgi:hypothetical protein